MGCGQRRRRGWRLEGREGCGMRWSWVVVVASGVRGRCDLSLCFAFL